MSISSLGVGSGLALDDLVRQLISAERQPRENRLNAREQAVDASNALGICFVLRCWHLWPAAVDECNSFGG